MNKGNSSNDCLPKFFKVYLPDDSGNDLDIPISFNSCLPKRLPKNVLVRSVYGNVWKLELRRCCSVSDTEKFVMVNGWRRIVKDEDLKGGEFLAFEFDGSRLFNFCVYGHATCKRLGSSVKTEEIEDESDSDVDKSSVDIIVIDDDDDGDDDDDDYDFDNDDQDSRDEEESSKDIIVLDDDSDDADDDDANSDQDYCGEDKSREDIIVIDDDDDDDDDDERRSGPERIEKGFGL